MKRSTRVTTLLLFWLIAQAVFVVGLLLWESGGPFVPGPMTGIALVGAGSFLVMWRVIGPLVPDAGRFFSGALKAAAMLVFYVYAGLTLIGMLSERASPLFPGL